MAETHPKRGRDTREHHAARGVVTPRPTSPATPKGASRPYHCPSTVATTYATRTHRIAHPRAHHSTHQATEVPQRISPPSALAHASVRRSPHEVPSTRKPTLPPVRDRKTLAISTPTKQPECEDTPRRLNCRPLSLPGFSRPGESLIAIRSTSELLSTNKSVMPALVAKSRHPILPWAFHPLQGPRPPIHRWTPPHCAAASPPGTRQQETNSLPTVSQDPVFT
jgi:hypothetical protein